jgi:protein-S-isoprenylcysteine O-methyltransferase Ste14
MFFSDPWFWAFLSTLGWAAAGMGIATRTLGRRLWLGLPVVALVEIPRIVLVLPGIPQPRIQVAAPLFVALGTVVLAVALAFGCAAFRIRPFTAPDVQEPLRTDGLYAVVRHPVMFCDAFWPLGLSLILRSVIGVALAPAWFLLAWLITFPEEEMLVREYGERYRDFQRRVPRIIPPLRRPRGAV